MANTIHRLLKYDMRGAQEQGVTEHPQQVMRKLGISYMMAVPQSMFDAWCFFIALAPAELPSYLEPGDVGEPSFKSWVGFGLSEHDAQELDKSWASRRLVPVEVPPPPEPPEKKWKAADISTERVIEVLKRNPGRWHMYETCDGIGFDGKPFAIPGLEDAIPVGCPEKVVRAKLRKMIDRGLIGGCACGCRGDFHWPPT